jgi:hypothetical protein
VTLAHDEAVRVLAGFATSVAGVPLLRVYWYDGTSTRPTPQHLTLAHLQNVKVRLGFVNSMGEQKGVDSLIVTDMINLARNRAIRTRNLLDRLQTPAARKALKPAFAAKPQTLGRLAAPRRRGRG